MLVNYLHIFHTDVYFAVQLSADKAFNNSSIIQLDDVKQNVGGGYIDDNNNVDYGKFIAPVTGTYQFIVTTMNKASPIYGELIINGGMVSQSYSGSSQPQTGITTTVVPLNAGDKVWIKSRNVNEYRARFTSFSGHLIHAYL